MNTSEVTLGNRKLYGEIQKVGFETLGIEPTTDLFLARFYYDTATGKLKVYRGSAWEEIIARATDAETIAGIVDNKYIAPSNLLAWFVDRRASLLEAQTGADNEKIMTPLRTADYVTARLATALEATTATNNTKLMTPLRVQEFLTSKFASDLESQTGTSTTRVTNPRGVEQYVSNRLATQLEAIGNTNNTQLMTSLRTYEQQTNRIATALEAQGFTDNIKLMTSLRTYEQVTARLADDTEAAQGLSTTKLMTPRGVSIYHAAAAGSFMDSSFVSATAYSAGLITVNNTTKLITSTADVYLDDPTETNSPINLGVLSEDFSAHVTPNPAVPWICYVDVNWALSTSNIVVVARSAFANAQYRYVLFSSDGVSSVLSGPRGYMTSSYDESITVPFRGGRNTLLAEADWGAGFGHKALYYKSNAATPAAAGVHRLGNAELFAWRDAGNTADLYLTATAADRLETNAPFRLVGDTFAVLSAKARVAGTLYYGTDTMALYLDDGTNPVQISASPKFEITYQGALPASVPHTLGGTPEVTALESIDSGVTWQPMNFGDIGTVDGTNINILSAPFTPTATHRLRFRAITF